MITTYEYCSNPLSASSNLFFVVCFFFILNALALLLNFYKLREKLQFLGLLSDLYCVLLEDLLRVWLTSPPKGTAHVHTHSCTTHSCAQWNCSGPLLALTDVSAVWRWHLPDTIFFFWTCFTVCQPLWAPGHIWRHRRSVRLCFQHGWPVFRTTLSLFHFWIAVCTSNPSQAVFFGPLCVCERVRVLCAQCAFAVSLCQGCLL